MLPVTLTRVNTARDSILPQGTPFAEAGDIGSVGSHPIADLRGEAKTNPRAMLNQPPAVTVGYGTAGSVLPCTSPLERVCVGGCWARWPDRIFSTHNQASAAKGAEYAEAAETASTPSVVAIR